MEYCRTIIKYLLILVLVGCTNKDYMDILQIEALNKYSKGEDQVIAIIDSGISNRLLNKYEDQIIGYYNIIDNTDNVKDYHGHGSEMASLFFKLNNKSKVIIIKIIDDDGNTNNKLLLKGIKKAMEYKATIINLSLGGYKQDKQVIKEIDNITNKGVSIVCASGDYGDKDLLFPACLDNAISVGAIDKNGKQWQDSNTGKNLVCSFLGVDIPIDDNILDNDIDKELLGKSKNGYIYKSGTSYSAIIASNYLSIIRSYYSKNNIAYTNKTLIKKLKSMDYTNYLKLLKRL